MNQLSPYAAFFMRLAVGGVFLRHGIVKVHSGVPAVAGFLHGGMTSWRQEKRPAERLDRTTVAELPARLTAEPDGGVLAEFRLSVTEELKREGGGISRISARALALGKSWRMRGRWPECSGVFSPNAVTPGLPSFSTY